MKMKIMIAAIATIAPDQIYTSVLRLFHRLRFTLTVVLPNSVEVDAPTTSKFAASRPATTKPNRSMIVTALILDQYELHVASSTQSIAWGFLDIRRAVPIPSLVEARTYQYVVDWEFRLTEALKLKWKFKFSIIFNPRVFGRKLNSNRSSFIQ